MTATAHRHSAASQFLTMLPHAVRDRLRLAGIFGVIIAGLAIMTGSLWPSLKNSFDSLPEAVSDTLNTVLAGSDFTTPAGWMSAETLSVVAPMGVIAVAVISISRGVAGEEQTKTLGMLLSAPVSRSTFVWVKATAMLVHVVVAVCGLAIGLVVGSTIGDLGLTAEGIVGACVHVGVLGAFFGAVALLVSAATGDRRLASATAAGLAVAAFAVSAFLPLSESLADGARFSPWFYFASKNPLVNGIDLSDALVLLGGAVALSALAVIVLRRRDLHG